MASTSLSPTKATEPSSVEWVYLAELDEPTVFEGYTRGRGDEDAELLDDLFTSTAAAEPSEDDAASAARQEDSNQCAEYFGDDGIVDDRIPPETAFETFLGKNFPVHPAYDFSSSLYDPRSHSPVQPAPRATAAAVLPGAESRQERLARLTSEVNALAAETGISDNSPTDAIFGALSELREQLRAIENASVTVPAVPSSMPLSSETPKDSDNDNIDARPKNVFANLNAPASETLGALEHRVSLLERAVGVTDLETQFDGTTLATLSKDVRARLAFITDEDLPTKLKEDAQQIAHMIRNDMQSQRAKDALRVATVLEKINSFFPLLDTLPLIIDRLVSVRRLHMEAANFSQALANLAIQLNRIEERRDANKDLLESVRSSLNLNIDTVNNNLSILRDHIDSVRQSSATASSETNEATSESRTSLP